MSRPRRSLEVAGTVIEEGRAYRVGYKRFPESANAKTYESRIQVLEILTLEFGRQRIITNHRPWDEGGTGQLYSNQIVSAEEIELPVGTVGGRPAL